MYWFASYLFSVLHYLNMYNLFRIATLIPFYVREERPATC